MPPSAPVHRAAGSTGEVRDDLGGRSERRVVERLKVCVDGTAGPLRRQPLLRLDAAGLVGVGRDQAAIDTKALAADQGSSTQRFTTVSKRWRKRPHSRNVRGGSWKGGVIRNRVGQIEPAEQPVGQVDMHLLAESCEQPSSTFLDGHD